MTTGSKILFLILCFILSSAAGRSQQKSIFYIDSLPVNSLQRIGGYKTNKICIDGKDRTTKFNKLYDENLDHKNDRSKITILNKKMGKYLSVGSFYHDGSSWNNVFIVGYAHKRQLGSVDFTTNDSFRTNNNISLGNSYQMVKERMGKQPDVEAVKDSFTIIKYYYYDISSVEYEYDGVPKYEISFKFEREKLIVFGFGNYRDFFVDDFNFVGFSFKNVIPEFVKKYNR